MTTSYWQNTIPAVPLSTDLPSTIDVAVIGGGITGASICYWLAREGISTALLEKNALAYGATGRNGGFVIAGPSELYQNSIASLGHESAKMILDLTCKSQQLLKEVIKEENIQCDYQEPGSLRLAITEEQLKELSEEAHALTADGVEATIIDHHQTQSLIKTPISSQIIGAQFIPNQGTVHSARLVQGLVTAACRHGAQAYQAEVLKIEAANDVVTLHTSQGTLQAKKVFVATNAWVSQLLPQLKDIIIPIREQMLAYAPIEPIFTAGMAANLVGLEYWQQRPDGTIVLGGCGSVEGDARLRVWDMQTTEKVQDALQTVLPQLFPALTHLQVTQRWAGLLDYTTDGTPIVDKLENMPGVYIVAGFSGHGMPFGIRIGQYLSKTINNNLIPTELKLYRWSRPTLKEWEIRVTTSN
ncbi:NAD(P)/FAD-dependent oxidoreductase [Dictyobacter kobayashii]|uniref:FAD-dependent oxidoreductase n=1 Tax=Dictyobacter kobayashii TaxID=2014872 RepID=A0A402AHN7_9CHLR|nr:FAD-dependent oxidoreductase [Dictyobacter kobayashii]GCE18642.1 FAD-dependent oxidoreductase [Dictyobacter kobayashii]